MPHAASDSASPWVARFLALAPAGGRVLDLAAGGGRHTRLARARGFPVTAVDRDVSGLAGLDADPDVEILAADLEGAPWPLGARKFAAVIITNYLHRPLFPNLVAAVADGGVLIYETFAIGNRPSASRRIRISCSGPASCSTPCAARSPSPPTSMARSRLRVPPSSSASPRCAVRRRRFLSRHPERRSLRPL